MSTDGILAIESLKVMEQMNNDVPHTSSPILGQHTVSRGKGHFEVSKVGDVVVNGQSDMATVMKAAVDKILADSPIETREYASYVCGKAGSTTVLGFMSGALEKLKSGCLLERFEEASKTELVPIDLGVGSHQIVYYQSHFYMADDFKPGALKTKNYDIYLTKTKAIDIQADNPPSIETVKKQDLIDLYGGAVSSEEFGNLIGTSRQAVDKQANSGNLLRFKKGARNWAYPSWQEHDGAILGGLRDTLKALGERSHWSKLLFFVSANRYLEGVLTEEIGTSEITPIYALREGYVEQVIAAIESDR